MNVPNGSRRLSKRRWRDLVKGGAIVRRPFAQQGDERDMTTLERVIDAQAALLMLRKASREGMGPAELAELIERLTKRITGME